MKHTDKKSFFITATDTGAGKTFVASGIVKALIADGLNVGVMKPVASGCRRDTGKGKLVCDDAVILRESAGVSDSYSDICPVMYEEPLAPLVAGRRCGTPVNLGNILYSWEKLRKLHDMMIIEGIGGLMVPLMENYYVADLIKTLEVPALIVARPSLGTINHTILTVNEAVRQGIKIAGIIFNSHEDFPVDTATRTNAGIIAELTGIPVIGTIPFDPTGKKPLKVFAFIARQLME